MSSHQQQSELSVPECRFLVDRDADAFLRFYVNKAQAESIYSEFQKRYTKLEPQGTDTLTPLHFILDEKTKNGVQDAVKQLQNRLPQAGQAIVYLTPEPDYAFTVILSERNIEQLTNYDPEPVDMETEANEDRTNTDGPSPQGDRYRQEFRLAWTAAYHAILQMEAALDGAEDPIETVDMSEVRAEKPD